MKQKDKIKSVAFVVARLNSSRLPAKQFRAIGTKSIIEWITITLKNCKQIDEIVITTVAGPENKPLQHFAKKNHLSFFGYEGDVNHLTSRLRNAADTFQADICILVSCDCPLIYAPAIDYLISQLKMTPEADYISVTEDRMGRKCALDGIFVSQRSTWQLADDLSDKQELKEHMFPVISKRPELFTKKECTIPMNIYFAPHRFSVDTWADLEFMNQIHQELTLKNKAFELPEVLKLLNEKPRLLEINSHVHQRTIIEDIRQILFIVDASKNIGFGHLMRCLELALQIIERTGWPVTFLIEDDYASEIIKNHGLRVIRGSLHKISNVSQPTFIYQMISNFSIVILDIYWKFNFEKGWRQKLIPHSKVIVLNRTESWAQEADQIIIPEVFTSNTGKFNLVGGLEYIIIRRDIRRVENKANNKTNDILAYLYIKEHRKIVKKFAADNDLSIILIDTFREDFPELLASSRYFISGFGYSFYEALFLGTIPLTMPLTKAHEKAASFFYSQTGMPSLMIKPETFSSVSLEQITLSSSPEAIKDGTKRIVQKITDIAKTSN